MPNEKTEGPPLKFRNFKIALDYYLYLRFLEPLHKKETSMKFNVLALFSNKYSDSQTPSNILKFPSIFTVGFTSLFSIVDLMKLKLIDFNVSTGTKLKDIFNGIMKEKRKVLMEKKGLKDLGSFNTYFRVTYSPSVFFCSLAINLSSFYFAHLIFSSRNSKQQEMMNFFYMFVPACLLVVPFKALQYESSLNAVREKTLIKDFAKLLNPNSLFTGYGLRFNFNSRVILPLVVIENWIGMFAFFHFNKAVEHIDIINNILKPNSEISSHNQKFLDEVCSHNETIRRSLLLYKQEKDSQLQKINYINWNFAKSLLGGAITGIIVTSLECTARLITTDKEMIKDIKFLHSGAHLLKLNMFKFVFQYGVCLSLLRSFDTQSFHMHI